MWGAITWFILGNRKHKNKTVYLPSSYYDTVSIDIDKFINELNKEFNFNNEISDVIIDYKFVRENDTIVFLINAEFKNYKKFRDHYVISFSYFDIMKIKLKHMKLFYINKLNELKNSSEKSLNVITD